MHPHRHAALGSRHPAKALGYALPIGRQLHALDKKAGAAEVKKLKAAEAKKAKADKAPGK